MREIERRYSGEWVLIVNPFVNVRLEVVRGEVACHSTDRDEVYRVAHRRKDPHTAILYVGKPPADMMYVL